MLMGYPKSGNSWIAQQLADYLQVPLPSQSIMPIGCDAVIQSHYAPSRVRDRGVYVLRDGRDVMVSLYYFLSWDIPAGDHPRLTSRQRQLYPGLVNKEDIKANLPAFIERQMRSPTASMGKNWGEHYKAYHRRGNRGLFLLRYEKLLTDPHDELGRVIEGLTGGKVDPSRLEATIEKYSFKIQSGRAPGEGKNSSFLRSGRVGDWRRHFTAETAGVFHRYCGDSLVEAGYEDNHDWAQSSEDSPLAA